MGSLEADAWRALGRLVNGQERSSPAALRRVVAGKTILVTGASFGIGEATARRLARAGATVLLVARTGNRLREVADDIAAHDGRAHCYSVNLSDCAEVDALVKQVLEDHGQVDVLVNNAGKSIRRSLELSYDRPQDFERTIDVNYLGPVRLTMGLLPSMRARGAGHIVNVSTVGVHGLPAAPRWSAYQASKAAFDVWMRSMALEVRGDGVTATNVYMGLVHTRMSAPTPIYRSMPGLSPRDAAGLVCDAIVRRPESIAPWWSPAAAAATTVLGGPIKLALRTLFRYSQDTASARGQRR
ncbi:MAG: SDR family NAD(P)-dependent oxidoreductase [Haloechinothrix sp.]